jgi:hypothetical protein
MGLTHVYRHHVIKYTTAIGSAPTPTPVAGADTANPALHDLLYCFYFIYLILCW